MGYTILTAEQREEILCKYKYRRLALEEASKYTIVALAEKYHCSKNTIWAMVRTYDFTDDKSQSAIALLEQKVLALTEENKELKRKVFLLQSSSQTIKERIFNAIRTA